LREDPGGRDALDGTAPPPIASPAPGGRADRARLTRRALLATGAAALGAIVSGRAAGSRGRRLAVVGASFGGGTAALTVKRLVPDADVVLLEQSSEFVFAPAVLQYLFGLIPRDRIVRGYGGLEAGGLRVVHATVVALERDRGQLVTTDGRLDYDLLLLATGLRLAPEQVPGLAERPEVNLCPYDTGAPPLELRRRLSAVRGRH